MANEYTFDNRSLAYEKSLPEPESVYVIDFFSGCGGMSWGFANTRQSHLAFEVLGGIDIDAKSLATYERNVAASGIEWDIREIADEPEMLLELIPEFDPDICRPLVFIGCPPCQGFSAHRKKDDRDDPRNDLLLTFARISAHYTPDVVVMENVPQILNGRYENYFAAAADELRKTGYHLTMEVLDLSLYGVPQRRNRAIILGSLDGTITLPDPVFSKENAPTVRDAISHLNPLGAGETDPADPYHRAPNHTERILERIRSTPPDGGDRRDLPEDAQLNCHISIDDSDTPGFTDVYGRLRWDEPSVTITAKSSTPSCGRFLHPEQHRNISVREAAILQGFPQVFAFEGNFVHQYRQIGEAVPPLFARFLAWQVLDHFSSLHKSKVHFKKTAEREGKEPASGIKTVDGFCGAGGLSLGFQAAGLETIFAFDTDTNSISTFNRNVAPVARQVDVRDPTLSEAVTAAVGNAQYIVVGGPPCQGFSQQRRGKDEDARNELVLDYADFIAALDPKPIGVVLENVTYIDSPRGQEILEEFKSRLSKLHYDVFHHELNSADYGVPQLRHRVFIVALDRSFSENYTGPQPLSAQRWPTIGEAFDGLPESGERKLLITGHEPAREGELNKRRIAFVDMGKGRMSIPYELQLRSHKKYDGHLDVYGRMDWFSQARTLTAGFDSFTRGEYAHPFRHRSITHREGARVQSFPDWFDFAGNRASVRHQIGNAVPPLLAFAVATAIRAAVEQPSTQERKELSQWVS